MKLGKLDEIMREKFFLGKGEVFLEFYSLLLFLLHVGNKEKAREGLIKTPKIVMKTCERFEKDKEYSVSRKRTETLEQYILTSLP